MKVLLLGPVVSHSIKWANALSKKGIDVVLVGFCNNKYLNQGCEVGFKLIDIGDKKELLSNASIFVKAWNYLKSYKRVKDIIKRENPNILHAHYASSYGFLAALSGFPYILSFWGSDIYEFPLQSFINKLILKFNINRSKLILSTSFDMGKQVKLYTDRKVLITPFGIDLNRFKPQPKIKYKDYIIIGTVKDLYTIYGIDNLIKAYAKVLKLTTINTKLLIIGGGPEEQSLKSLVSSLELNEKVDFIGAVPFDEVVAYHNEIDVFSTLSRAESFGVSVIEASACEKPVVVSNVGGLPEVVDDGITGFVVNEEVVNNASLALLKLVEDENLRIKMGKEGRKKVTKLYKWDDNVELMVNIYKDYLKDENYSIS